MKKLKKPIFFSDVDECKLRFAGCAYQCNNTIGSFQCICPSGYVLNADNRSCSGTLGSYVQTLTMDLGRVAGYENG